MILQPVRDTQNRTYWRAVTEDENYDGVGNDPLEAVTRLAEVLENEIRKADGKAPTSNKF